VATARIWYARGCPRGPHEHNRSMHVQSPIVTQAGTIGSACGQIGEGNRQSEITVASQLG
jgi:hypothetical protein